MPGSYSFTGGTLPAKMTTLSQESSYEYQTSPLNGAYNWNMTPTRSMSAGEAEDLSHGFPVAYRTSTYPSFERRMTGDMQQLPHTSTAHMPMSMASQQHSMPPEFREPTPYRPVRVDMQHDWGGGGAEHAAHLAGPVGSSYSPGWYAHQPGLTDVREEVDHPHILPSQSHGHRGNRHKPG